MKADESRHAYKCRFFWVSKCLFVYLSDGSSSIFSATKTRLFNASRLGNSSHFCPNCVWQISKHILNVG